VEWAEERVAAAFAHFDTQDATQILRSLDLAFASVNDMAALSAHSHLRRIAIKTPREMVALPAPAPIFDDSQRRYGAVPDLGQHEPIEC